MFLAACCGVSCRHGLCYFSGIGAEQFPVFPGQRLLLQFYAYAVTCGHSFTVLSVCVLISLWIALVFSPTLLPLLFLLPFIFLLLFLIIIGYYITVISISTELLAL